MFTVNILQTQNLISAHENFARFANICHSNLATCWPFDCTCSVLCSWHLESEMCRPSHEDICRKKVSRQKSPDNVQVISVDVGACKKTTSRASETLKRASEESKHSLNNRNVNISFTFCLQYLLSYI